MLYILIISVHTTLVVRIYAFFICMAYFAWYIIRWYL